MDVLKELALCKIQNLIREGNIIKNYCNITSKKEAVSFLQKELKLSSPYPIMLRLFFANVDNISRVLKLYRKDVLTFSDIRYLGCCSKTKQALLIKKKIKAPSTVNASLINVQKIVDEMNELSQKYCTLKNISSPPVQYHAPEKLLNIHRTPRGRIRGAPSHSPIKNNSNYYEDLDMVITNPEHEANYEEYRKIIP